MIRTRNSEVAQQNKRQFKTSLLNLPMLGPNDVTPGELHELFREVNQKIERLRRELQKKKERKIKFFMEDKYNKQDQSDPNQIKNFPTVLWI